MEEYKRCTHCDALYPDTEEFFAPCVAKNTGKVYSRKVCRACHYKQVRNWHAAHPERMKEISQRRYKDKFEEVMLTVRAYRARQMAAIHIPYTEAEVLAFWGTKCHICGEEVDLTAGRHIGISEGWEHSLHLEHVVPLIAGGTDTIGNVKPAHARCNLTKAKQIPKSKISKNQLHSERGLANG